MPAVLVTGIVWLDARARALIEREACRRPRTETGGALFGYGEGDELVVACAYGPGPCARHRRTSFEPHPGTTAALMDAVHAHSAGRYRYLGSWHTHPGGLARPSSQDVSTTELVAAQPQVRLERPLVLIQATQSVAGVRVTAGELRAWCWEPEVSWLLPREIQPVELETRYCPTIDLTLGWRRGRRRHRLSPDSTGTDAAG